MSRSIYVQNQTKQLPYTVEPIGDALALKYWKERQAEKARLREAALAPVREARRQSAMDMVKHQEVNPFKHTEEDKVELTYRRNRLQRAKERQAEAAFDKLVFEEPKASAGGFWSRIKSKFGL